MQATLDSRLQTCTVGRALALAWGTDLFFAGAGMGWVDWSVSCSQAGPFFLWRCWELAESLWRGSLDRNRRGMPETGKLLDAWTVTEFCKWPVETVGADGRV
mmetsp:Transcript_15347/g.38852  ORF Transcript_15347/g.38852 Transcript_15347/m.38852 type:complete len:102 (+) Transcript_15347:2400-2705(+)